MSNGDKNCTNCEFFKAGKTGVGEPEFPGWCVRFPPVQHTLDSGYSFVPVGNATWCGEYKHE
jgi:hypothetical protein